MIHMRVLLFKIINEQASARYNERNRPGCKKPCPPCSETTTGYNIEILHVASLNINSYLIKINKGVFGSDGKQNTAKTGAGGWEWLRIP